MAWGLLSAAILVELCATAGVKYSDGFTRPLVAVGVLAGYGLSFFLMSRAVSAGMQISVGYAVWSGIGTAAIALIGAAILDEPLTPREGCWNRARGVRCCRSLTRTDMEFVVEPLATERERARNLAILQRSDTCSWLAEIRGNCGSNDLLRVAGRE